MSTFSKIASIKSMARKIKKNVKVNVTSMESPQLDMYPGEAAPNKPNLPLFGKDVSPTLKAQLDKGYLEYKDN